jgi:hypothetical protein
MWSLPLRSEDSDVEADASERVWAARPAITNNEKSVRLQLVFISLLVEGFGSCTNGDCLVYISQLLSVEASSRSGVDLYSSCHVFRERSEKGVTVPSFLW